MFNYATSFSGFSTGKVLGGIKRNDNSSFRTLYCGKLIISLTKFKLGPDPACPDRVLIRKLVELNEGSWAHEEIRVTKVAGRAPEVHT